ncbi:hypothetical protein A2U01_0109021 [Trifolium medium]|uniref:Uncharacterized protein n=1 Tax=Trifolium medium TaxID=97028 RepID=A0A392VH59_9FABA|nr:hypothetical protein [Trifolium medium]
MGREWRRRVQVVRVGEGGVRGLGVSYEDSFMECEGAGRAGEEEGSQEIDQ